MNVPQWLSDATARTVRARFGTPAFVYDRRQLETQAEQVQAWPAPYGLTVRYAMKACPNAAVIGTLVRAGLGIDASSGFEAWRAIRAGVSARQIQLTTQELPPDLEALLDAGIEFNASSVAQLRAYGRLRPGTDVSLRVNPGLGSGHSARTNVGGPSASFGVWHEHLDRAQAAAAEHGVSITGVHSHIGSGTHPETWQRCASMTLAIAARLPLVERISLGGGFKVARMPGETSADMERTGQAVARELEGFFREHGRRLRLEIEPGTFLVANAGALICSVTDVVDTGEGGYRFIKTDTGMTEILRPSLYGAQHPIRRIAGNPGRDIGRERLDYLVVGHCCESGDVLTPAPGDPEGLAPRELPPTEAGDLLVIGGAGAYCASMCAKNYNSFPEAPEIMQDRDGTLHVIRQRQTLDQIVANEIVPENLV